MKSGAAPNSPTLWLIGLAGLLVGWSLAAAPAAYSAPDIPLPLFNAEYSLKRNGVTLGTSTRSLSAAPDGVFVYASSTQAAGLIAWFVKDHIDEHSKWSFDGGRIRPIEYVYHRHGGSKTRLVKLNFDWQHLTVTNIIEDDHWRMEIPPDAQDKLVYQLAIMYDLMNGKKKRFFPVEIQTPVEGPNETYPLWIIPGGFHFHYGIGTTVKRAKGLAQVYPESSLKIHPEDAVQAGIKDGDLIRVISPRGDVETLCRICEDIPRGIAYLMTFFFPVFVNNLLVSNQNPESHSLEYKMIIGRVEKR